jgi:ABC-type Na+ efflux pump permease subunit
MSAIPAVKAPPRTRMAGLTSSMESIAAFVIGTLVVGIVLGIFIMLSNMQFSVNGTKYTLIPSQVASITQSSTITLISILVVIAIVVILVPMVKHLMDLFGKGGGGR